MKGNDIMAEFTKGEWTVPFRTRRDGDNRCWVMRGKISICRCFGKPKVAEANAQELVRRWNSHDDLLAACDEGLHECERVKINCTCELKDISSLLKRIERIEAAISQARD
jgi:hypothetical protein